ncbi:MAG: hypothetical protein COV55_05020 [Candidatus Komeilibacteria bacterium CG11_big_fil_rev_8_21_14_0_20_36_20]|uniref:NYN domain-containing protein n=1 Tax=Candidatus Komeilibacteria bacterium CG11_big_fil_rev_8_21_14_0_20_36_20 TaxID=1974477 RepID=A0A2H0NAZ3_9BACT|nr:MAG: hypothetical protein COV55_05020 [Candidatus Komeilibacteria bacterium CG11_big_fil_rev_8_21_14_0_20_36_20]PIR82062.1 MAG: hypothetical protein COU21_00255 [Candidatus Komeilibacteria bacterium CG10_big_fil_rev_8_21_14_0_10_36_65]PJC55041.1 MAG: hypothetical protein CO027_04240 [Candidatus Komeilibacteria bacterium CG_4_9_14_0_2_um_filter_36_13]
MFGKFQKERVQIFIDGGNFYHLVLKKLNIRELDFSFEEFVNFLVNNRDISLQGKRYYVGTVREIVGDERTKKAMSNQTKLFTILRFYDWEIKTSKLRTRIEKIIIDDRIVDYKKILKKGIKFIEFKRSREKGIDVKLATDMIVAAVDDKYDTAIVVSSDADIVPAIDWIRKRTKKKVEYIGFSILDETKKYENTKPLQTMITYSDVQRILTNSDLKPFIKPFIKKTK